MEVKERKKYRNILKEKNKKYLLQIDNDLIIQLNFKKRFDKLRHQVVGLLRKEENSENGYKELKSISSLLFGIIEDIKQQKIQECDFDTEKKIINNYLKKYIEKQISTNYDNTVNSFGEALLCGYLDCFLNTSKTEIKKELGINPSFLINPDTNMLLEIDVALKDYQLYFEFQGDLSHYEDEKTIIKDNNKLEMCFSNNIVLVPINISQLNTNNLITVIINTIKDYLGINKVIIGEFKGNELHQDLTNKQLLNFSRLIQKIFLSTMIHNDTLKHLDNRANVYIGKMINRNPDGYSQNKEAPRFIDQIEDFDIGTVYYGLKNITKYRKKRL